MIVHRTYKRHHKVKKKKPILKNLYFWLIILLILFISVLFYLGVFWDKIQIKEIRISGNYKVDGDKIIKIVFEDTTREVFFKDTRSILLFKKNEIKDEILKLFPEIEEVKISRKLPDVLVIEIKEREPFAVFCQLGNCFFIDKNGVIFRKYENEEELQDKPVVRFFGNIDNIFLGKKIIEKDFFDIILIIEKNLRNDFQINITEMTTDSDKRLNIKTNEGWEAYFNLKEDMNLQVLKLTLLLKEEISLEQRTKLEYIDLRFSRAYYK